jgi:hypothetical protein
MFRGLAITEETPKHLSPDSLNFVCLTWNVTRAWKVRSKVVCAPVSPSPSHGERLYRLMVVQSLLVESRYSHCWDPDQCFSSNAGAMIIQLEASHVWTRTRVFTVYYFRSVLSHASFPVEDRTRMGITDNLVRLSVGLEDTDDIISDLDLALRSAVSLSILLRLEWNDKT